MNAPDSVAPAGAAGVTVAIATAGRDRVLVETLRRVLALRPAPAAVIVVDQAPAHDAETREALSRMEAQGGIRVITLERRSIPHAMNTALRAVSTPLVLFLDDDVEPRPDLAAAHALAYAGRPDVWAVAGQVLLPGETPQPPPPLRARRGLRRGLEFRFRSSEPAEIATAMATNLSVRRERALDAGGFDENFIGAAYRFETEFARRLIRRGGRVLFEPAAGIVHLRVPSGGTRLYGNHLASASPMHGVGDYYFALRCGAGADRVLYMLRRPFREVATRFHARHPWWIPVKLIGELRALLLAFRLNASGPRHV